MTFAEFLMGMAGPLAMRVLITLGIGTITFTGMVETLSALIAMSASSWSGITPAVLQLAGLSGLPECIGLITGAMTSRVSIWAATSATKFVLSPAS